MEINHINLTDQGKSLCIALENGFCAYSINPLKKRFQCKFENTKFGNCITINDSNIVVCNGTSPQSKNNLFHEKTFAVFDATLGRQVFMVNSTEQIKNIFMTLNMFGYSTKSEVRIYSFIPPIIQYQFYTSINEYAPCDFVENENNFTVCFVGREPGMLRMVQSRENNRQDISVPAHSHPLSLIKINPKGEIVSTVSMIGTLIQLYDTKTGEMIGKFRRGKLPAEITCMDFSPDSSFLAVSSSKCTIHLFSLSNLPNTNQNPPRAVIKLSFPELGLSPFCFTSKNYICAALNCGIIHILKINKNTNSFEIESSESFIDLINKEK